MATMIYVTGNGYNCSCCRQTDTDYIEVDETNIDSIIETCLDISAGSDGDFSITEIIGCDIDVDQLEKRVKEGVEEKLKIKKKKQKLSQLKSAIAAAESWFVNLDKTKAEKLARLNDMHKQLAELENE